MMLSEILENFQDILNQRKKQHKENIELLSLMKHELGAKYGRDLDTYPREAREQALEILRRERKIHDSIYGIKILVVNPSPQKTIIRPPDQQPRPDELDIMDGVVEFTYYERAKLWLISNKEPDDFTDAYRYDSQAPFLFYDIYLNTFGESKP